MLFHVLSTVTTTATTFLYSKNFQPIIVRSFASSISKKKNTLTKLPKLKYSSKIMNVPCSRVLCVAEKHDAAKNIARFLSNGAMQTVQGRSKYNPNFVFRVNFNNASNVNFVFTSVRGHVTNYDFHQRHKNWIENQIYGLFDGEIEQIVPKDNKLIEANLKTEAKKADVLIIWTDCDREGEHIGNEIAQICLQENRKLRVRRARFSEITRSAVERGLRNLGNLNQKVVEAVECRMELDLRIGAAFTRLQTLYIKRNNLHRLLGNTRFTENKEVISYGSCQFPTLGFVVERFKENRSFVREPYWKLTGKDGKAVEFHWEREGLSVQIFDQQACEAVKNACNGAKEPARVKQVLQKPKSKWRPEPMDTIQLEKLGNRHLKLSAHQVMNAANKLYQNGYISYPRTETNCYSENFDLASIVDMLAGNNDWRDFAQQIQQQNGGPRPRNGRKNDQAHPPIHPVKYVPRTSITSNDEWRVYELVCKHFLASVSRDATGKETKVKVQLEEELFTATGLIIEDLGYLQIYNYEKWGERIIPPYQQGQMIANFRISMSSHSTEPPPLLTEADLITLMDKKGIGTDATHAEHIETIKKRWYVVLRPDSRFEPTKLGLALVDAYERMRHLHLVYQPYLRAALEVDLEKICRGVKSKKDVLEEQLKIYRDIFRTTEMKINMLGQTIREHTNPS